METTQFTFGFPYTEGETQNGLPVGRWYYALTEPSVMALGDLYAPISNYAIYEEGRLIVFGCWNDDDTLAEFADMLEPEDFFGDYEDYLDYQAECTEPDWDECFPPDWVVEMRQVVSEWENTQK